jgi:Glycosyltransferase (GlcNAc)
MIKTLTYSNKTIFVMIPAYRDPILRETLDSVFNNAKYPDRVFVAIAAQYDEDIVMPSLEGIPDKNIRLLRIHPENRPGVYRLRHILNKLYAGEDYYMSIDSHTFMSNNWDEELISTLESFKDQKIVLQAYEPDYEEGSNRYLHTQMSVSVDNEAGIPRLVMRNWYFKNLPANGEMPISNYVQAGMIFSRGLLAQEVRWGELWQNDQEEPFLSFELFMLGWTSRLMVKERIISHKPDRYYQVVYNAIPKNHNRNFADSWNVQKDNLNEVCPKIFQAMIHNSGPFRIANAVRSPKDWWYSIGLGKQYEHYKDYI